MAALGAEEGPSRDRAADLLVRAYRSPVIEALQYKWNLDKPDAEDAAQEFFMVALEKAWFANFDPSRGKFRTFVWLCANRFAANLHQSATRKKRGGGQPMLSVEELEAVLSDADDVDTRFRQEWSRSILSLAVESLRDEATGEGREVHFEIFEQYDLIDHLDGAGPTYRQLAEKHALSHSQVINHLAWARRRFRVSVLAVLRSLAGSKAEYREDVRELLGIEAP